MGRKKYKPRLIMARVRYLNYQGGPLSLILDQFDIIQKHQVSCFFIAPISLFQKQYYSDRTLNSNFGFAELLQTFHKPTIAFA